MRRSLGYALLFAVPSGTAVGSGIWLMTRDELLGLTAGLAVGLLLSMLVWLGREHGSADEDLADGP